MANVRAKSQPGAARDDGDLDARRAGDPVHDLVDRAVAADDDEQRRSVVDRLPRERRPAGPARSERSASPASPRAAARWAISGQRRPVEPPAEAGLTRKTVACANGRRPAVAVSSAIRVIRSTAARSSSSEIRTNSPSTTMSLTVRRQPVWTPRSAPSVKSTAASISTARMPRFDQRSYWPLVGVVEEVARDDRADAQRQVARLRDVDGLVDRAPSSPSGSAARRRRDVPRSSRRAPRRARRSGRRGRGPAAARRTCPRGGASSRRAGSAPRRRSPRRGSPCRFPGRRRAFPPILPV